MSFRKDDKTGILFKGTDGLVAVTTEGIEFLTDLVDLKDFHDRFEVASSEEVSKWAVPIPLRQVNVYAVMLNIYHIENPDKYVFRPVHPLESVWLQNLIDHPDVPDGMEVDLRAEKAAVKRLIENGYYVSEWSYVLSLFDHSYYIREQEGT